MIICSCNALTRAQILEAAASEPPHAPRSPAQTYRCLGCAPDCGRCLVTVRRILGEARAGACAVSCPACPGHAAAETEDSDAVPAFAIAAE
ncbi:(2Fe-2S)-binding protein [Rhabdaerophilum calidifontis]|uniref:(2Fe-2S)-binding protein n=1 Tax=Rhabdaerophilum calidifontis TaxID=2604328 RepID=UPI00123BF34D|nr:(2Fe-2S)-binding protein [Rhabdaerophilum calidifontis]